MTAGTILIVLCSIVFPIIVGIVIVLSPEEEAMVANDVMVCSVKMLLNGEIVVLLSAFGVDKLMGVSSIGSGSDVLTTMKNEKH